MTARVIFAAFCLLLSPGAVLAMINPQEFMDEAPEKAGIEILSTWNERGGDGVVRTALVAKVTSVDRSKAGLKAGDTILIAYTVESPEIDKARKEHERKAKGMAGPQFLQPPAAPKPGEKVTAYLRPNAEGKPANRVFAPGAHQYSFEPAP